MDQTFLKAFAEVIKEKISQKQPVEIEGLGVFRVEHQKQYQQQFDNGRVVMMPPKDQVLFKED
ncbi:MAG: HU family DNA-binding protein [Balneolaceae bacterium]|nr:HU family DNA-binding protein [Balneolaceae bacterium]